ncbi:FadR/GntR family transcriptional regulator [Nocardia brasiliensis]|uniref:FadR/GntR family transcriptional regulator n=1 Tax=Nocardia brasiliensis TaxID=37326 RepID=UPI001893D6F7|nr:GntR family transcriptional regulator [Nocardia brasiliensis]MBF6129172.1 FadR family transcriptional regulator [Nocardia brasiliensis]
MALQPVVKRSVSGDVFEQIVADVLSGELAPGATLPSERQLAEALGVSRPAVREALQRLAAAGLVSVRQGDATTVLDYWRGAGLEVLPRLLVQAGELDPAVARSILEARLHNGPKVAELAAARAARTDAAAYADGTATTTPPADSTATTTPPADSAGITSTSTTSHATPSSTNTAGATATAADEKPGQAASFDALTASVEMLAAAEDAVARQRLALDFWDHVVDAADSIVFRLMFNMLRAAYEPALVALAPIMSAEVGNVGAYRELAAAIVAGRPQEAAETARALLEPATTALIEVLGGH